MIIPKPYVFITGAPRSGTSMITKIIDSHPDVGILMENVFGLRRRHWVFPDYWYNDEKLFQIVNETFSELIEPIVGNKVCVPDVWNTDEVMKMCGFFSRSKIIFMVRNPVSVVLSRQRRDNDDEYSNKAKKYLCLDWSDKSHTSISSWRQSIEVYWKLKESMKNNVLLVYYDDFVNNFDLGVEEIFDFLDLPMSESVRLWHKLPHYDSKGNKVMNLKYKDKPVSAHESNETLPKSVQDHLNGLVHYQLWEKREI